MGGDGFGFAAHRFQHGVARPGFAVAEGKVETVRTARRRAGGEVVQQAGIPERAGHAGGAGEYVRLIERPDGKEAGERITCEAAPRRRSGQQRLRLGEYVFRQQGQAIARAAGKGPSAPERRGRPRRKIALPVKAVHADERVRRGVREGCAQRFGHVLRGAEAEQRRGDRGGIDLRAQVFRGKNRHSPSPPFLCGVTAIIAHPLKAVDEDRLLRGGGQSMRAFYQR